MCNRNVNDSRYVINHSVEIQNGRYGRWIYKRDETPRFECLGAAVYLQKIFINAETMERTLILSSQDAQGKHIVTELERKNLTETGVMELLAKGIQVTKKTAEYLIASIMNQEPDVECEIRHEELGFRDFEGKIVFFGSDGIGVESVYNGKLSIKQTGDFQTWKSMVESEVLNTDLETIVAISATAPLVDLLKEDVHIANILISLVGESSTGKTSAGCLAVSLGSKCSFTDNSMMATFADTSNALMRSIYSSYPMLIDEGSLIRYNPTSIIYELAEGKEKRRLTKELKSKSSRTFSTAIFMTSEKSILNLCDENSGLYVRCLEFQGVSWTRSAESAEKIKTICEQNYGFVIPIIARYLLKFMKDQGKEKILDRYREYQKGVISSAKEKKKYTSLTERLSKQVALILLGAEVFSEVTGIHLNISRIAEFIEKETAIFDIEKLDICNKALDYLCQYVSVRYSQFVKSESGTSEKSVVPNDCKGKIQTLDGKLLPNGRRATVEIYLPEIVFEEILMNGGFPDKNVVLKRFKEEGYLHAEADRYISKFVVATPPAVKGYRIYIPAEQEKILARRAQKTVVQEQEEK